MEENKTVTPGPDEQKLRVAAYCRVSTDSDSQDGSFETQMSYYEDYISRRPDYTLVGVYGDHGKSGRSMKKRPELNRLLKDCEDGKIDLVLTKSVSRFARNLPECVEAVRKLKSQHVAVWFERENLNTGDERNEMLLSILATIAQEESRSISQNLLLARRKRYEMGEPWDNPGYGYRYVKKDRTWAVVESKAGRVKMAFYLAGIGTKYKEIREALNELEEVEETGKVWNQSLLGLMLKNNIYTGDFLTNKSCQAVTEDGTKQVKNEGQRDQFYIEGHHEAFVSHELFEGVGRMLAAGVLNTLRRHYTDEELTLMEECRQIAEKEMGWK